LQEGINVFFVDEAGVNTNQPRKRGRALRGEKVYNVVDLKPKQKTNILAAWINGKILAPLTYLFTTKGWWFETWFQNMLCPAAEKGSVIVMDNARFHRKKILGQIAESFGLIIEYLPPYAPDLNPIEHHWGNFKDDLRLKQGEYVSVDDAYFKYIEPITYKV
jgi:hypothetical protein